MSFENCLEEVKSYCRSLLLANLPSPVKERINYISLGKSIRPKLVFEVASILETNIENLIPYASFIECIHSISIIQDDFIDQELKRRNESPLNAIFDAKTTLFTSTLILSRFYEKILEIPPPQNIVVLFSEKINELCLGEVMQDLSLDTVNLEKSLKVIRQKTGSLFGLSFSLPSLLNPIYEKHSSILEEIGYLYGVFFQLSDDLKDLFNDVEHLFSKEKSPQLSFLFSLWAEKDELSFKQFVKNKNKDDLHLHLDFINENLKDFAQNSVKQIQTTLEKSNDKKLEKVLNLLFRDYEKLLS